MAFIKRIGTEEVHFNVEIHLQKLSLNINAPDCLVHVLFQRGERKIQTHQPALLQNKIAFLSEVLELPITFYHDRKKKVYQEKTGYLYILLQGARGMKKAGEIHIDFSEYLNQNLSSKNQVLHLDKCPDPEARLQVNIVLVQNNHSLDSKKDQSQMNHHESSSITPTKINKNSPKQKKPESVNEKPQVSLKLIGSLNDFKDMSPIMEAKSHDKQLTESEINSLNDFLEAKEELKYLRIEMGQQKNNMAKLLEENSQLVEKLQSTNTQKGEIEEELNILEGRLKVSQKENQQLQQMKAQQSEQDSDANSKSQIYGSNIELQQLMIENKKLNDNLQKIKKERDILKEQIISQDLSGRSPDISDDERSKLQQKIAGLEQRLQNDPNAQENKISRLAIENEQMKRKINDISERHTIELGKLTDQNEDSMEESIRSYREQVETLTIYKNKYDNMNAQFRKNQSDLENLTSLKFDLEDMINEKDSRIQQLGLINIYMKIELQLQKVKQNIAGAMTEFLNYGDTNSIDIMEYFMT